MAEILNCVNCKTLVVNKPGPCPYCAGDRHSGKPAPNFPPGETTAQVEKGLREKLDYFARNEPRSWGPDAMRWPR
jgi:hypothetical protein